MSYEGYVEKLCAAGHRRVFDAYEVYGDEPAQCSCGQHFVFRHDVDQTNCEGEPYKFEVATLAVTETCNLGHVHMIEETRFKVPEKV